MARRREATRTAGKGPRQQARKKATVKVRVRSARRPGAAGAGEGPTSSARGNWIDTVDRVAKRPFLEGDYLPGSKGPSKRARG